MLRNIFSKLEQQTMDLLFWKSGDAFFYVICIPVQTLITMIAIAFGTRLLYQLHYTMNHNMRTIYRYATIICTISCILCLLMDLLHLYWCDYADISIFDGTVMISHFYVIADFWYYLATNAFYIIAFLRLRLTFTDTAYRLSKRAEYPFIALIFSSIVGGLYYAAVHVATMTTVAFFYKWVVPAIIILMINDCILNSVLMVMFVRRLRHHIQELETNSTMEWHHHLLNDGESGDRAQEISLTLRFNQFSDRRSRAMIDVVTMHTNLFGLAVLTNQLFLASLLWGFWFVPIQFYVFLFRGFECCANVLVLYLSYTRNRKSYYKYCKSCHSGTKKCCIHMTKKNVQRHILKKIAEQDEQEREYLEL